MPTERQRRYKAMYDKELRNAGVNGGAGADALEKQVVLLLLKQYADLGLVPAGEIWVKTPAAIREKAKTGEPLTPPVKAGKKPPSIPVLAGFGVGILFMIILLVGRGRGAKSTSAALTGTLTPTLDATLVKSLTPTALALENQDSAIQGGDTGNNALAYPVNLRVQLPSDKQPRVFVVQRRAVRTAEWSFDLNPDIASFLTGMSIRPVIGIPWSDVNALLFRQLASGSVFTLQLNTGATLRYEYQATQVISRSETAGLRQMGPPGLELVLIGERDADGALTASRWIVTAAYHTEQELSRDGLLVADIATGVPTLTPTPTTTPAARLNVEVIAITSDEPNQSVIAQMRIFNSSSKVVQIDRNSFWIAYGYVPHPSGPRLPAEGLAVVTLLPNQAVDLTIHFPWAREPYGSLGTDGLGPDGTYEFTWQFGGRS